MCQASSDQDRDRVSKQRRRWSVRTDEARAHDRIRQQRSRLRRKIRPREPPPLDTDPWAIADEALAELAMLRLAVKTAHAPEHLERVEQCIRRLAWGPGD